jgi:hypothetical protein
MDMEMGMHGEIMAHMSGKRKKIHNKHHNTVCLMSELTRLQRTQFGECEGGGMPEQR